MFIFTHNFKEAQWYSTIIWCKKSHKIHYLYQNSINQLSGVICCNNNQLAFGFQNLEICQRVFQQQVLVWQSLHPFCQARNMNISRNQYKVLPVKNYNWFFYPYQRIVSGPQLLHPPPSDTCQSRFVPQIDTIVSEKCNVLCH